MTLESAYEYVIQDNLAKKLYEYIGLIYNERMIRSDIINGYLTFNEGFDGNDYVWYMDESHYAAIRESDGEIIGDPDKLDELFFGE